jgi:hypothetical protein
MGNRGSLGCSLQLVYVSVFHQLSGLRTDWGNIRIVYLLLQVRLKYHISSTLCCGYCCSTWKLMVLMLLPQSIVCCNDLTHYVYG